MPYPFNESDGESETSGMELTEENNKKWRKWCPG
jgi:hypothetical protein